MKNLLRKFFGVPPCSKELVFQPFPFQGGFEKKKISDDGKRTPLSREAKAKLEQMVIGVSELFKDSNIKWSIDGGLSISLLRGDFIGQHRDIDVAVEASELKQLQKVVEAKGYGLFVTLGIGHRETMCMKRVNWKEFASASTYLFWIIAVDKDGLIQKDMALSFINIHIIKRSKQGLPLGGGGVELPESWFDTKTIDFHGNNINVATPVKTAYYKLQSLRNYDLTDLRHMFESGLIEKRDIEEIERVMNGESCKKCNEDYYKARKRTIDRIKRWD